ncbi:MAG: peptidoglycan DD-metalloendopeptidase family protein [Muribaculaceae bacterium]|nr:peptidoglycan DD-metalloendopeptidase family protein [Muribaculaceae bacterium]MBR1475861.1 peptidoglycan DD-metalloendopeptidase family protein [Muribaculaceae bacterium]MBR1727254.1 peptidoglycan DD-metalloendopeptidase family protein [Muribaculaceae bacterium]
MSIRQIITMAVVAVMAITANHAAAQNLQSAKNNSRMHKDLLARQSRIQDQIKLEEAQKYASQLYEEEEPEPDIYTEGWESDRVNPYKNANVPQTKVIDVRGFHMPIKGNYITSPYGYRPAFRRTHKGVDMRSAVGDTVYAAFTGKVRLTKFERGGYGFYVILRHDNGLETVYGHLTRFLVQPNQFVKAGQPIALSGNTGRSTGPHLHFETRFMGYAINPAAIIDFANRTTHTDTYTFNKSNYTESRSYAPSRRYAAVRSTSNSSSASYSKSSKGHKYDSKTRKRSAQRSTYKVRKGDNLGKIAARNGTTVAQLKKMNGIKGDKVQSGKVLRVK